MREDGLSRSWHLTTEAVAGFDFDGAGDGRKVGAVGLEKVETGLGTWQEVEGRAGAGMGGKFVASGTGPGEVEVGIIQKNGVLREAGDALEVGKTVPREQKEVIEVERVSARARQARLER